MEIQFHSPVTFPSGWERTPQGAAKIDSNFAQNMTITEALRSLKDELALLSPDRVVFYSNYESISNDARRFKRGNSEGVGLKIFLDNTEAFLACDKWHNIIQNIYALHLAVRYFRMYEEWGIATAEYILNAFATEQKQQHTQAVSHDTDSHEGLPDWMQKLGLGPTATLQDANSVYRLRAKQFVDDEHGLLELNQAIEQARHALRT